VVTVRGLGGLDRRPKDAFDMLPDYADMKQLKAWFWLPADGHAHGTTGKLKHKKDRGNPLNTAAQTILQRGEMGITRI
jgi:hypothetical protein